MTVPRFPERIVCLTEETTETLYLLGQGHRVVGVSGYTVRPPEARSKPKVSAFINARFDKIESLRPDLVLAFSDLQADLCAELIRRGLTVVAFNQRSVGEILQMIRMLGGLVGCQTDAERLAGALESDLAGIRASAARFPSRLRVFFEEWDDPLISGIRWVEELVEIAGGAPTFPELAAAGLGRDRRGGGGAAKSGGHHRVMVRQEGEEGGDPRPAGLGKCGRGERRTHLRSEVDIHPAAWTGVLDRGRSPASRAARTRAWRRCRGRTWAARAL
jgi:hypothetical protein